jgi:hypothetical protein
MQVSIYILLGISIFSLLLLVLLFAAICLVFDRLGWLREVNARLEVVENHTAQIVAELLGDDTFDVEGGEFRSLDGKIVASSMEELLQKMSEQPDTTEEDIDQLKKFFTEATDEASQSSPPIPPTKEPEGEVLSEWSDDEEDEDEDDEDDSDDGEGWKKP